MKRLVIAALAGLLTAAMAQRFSVEGSAGLYTGFSGQLAVVAEDFPGLPLGLRLGVGFASTDALDDNVNVKEVLRALGVGFASTDALDDNVNVKEVLRALGAGFASTDALDEVLDKVPNTKFGDAKKNSKLSEWGQNVTVSLDVLYKLAQVQGISVAPYVGVRYNMFSGGVTDPEGKLQDVFPGLPSVKSVKSVTFSSNAFGFGLGVRAAYPVMPNLSLVGDVGADYYLRACIRNTMVIRGSVNSEDVSISRTVCPSASGYESHNKFVTQPDGWVLKLRLGVAYRF